MESHRADPGREHRAPGHGLGRGQSPQQRGRHPRITRCLQRRPAPRDRVLDAPGQRRTPLRQIQGHRCSQPQRRANTGPQKRPAQFCPGRCRAARCSQRTLRRHPGTAGRDHAKIQRKHAGRHRQICPVRERRPAQRCARRCGASHPRRRAKRGARRPPLEPENAGLFASDAVCRQRRTARATLQSLCHPRLRPSPR